MALICGTLLQPFIGWLQDHIDVCLHCEHTCSYKLQNMLIDYSICQLLAALLAFSKQRLQASSRLIQVFYLLKGLYMITTQKLVCLGK